ncbi:GNAT family N-acetyltransferase [Rhizobium sp. PAMB 3174]
MQTDTPFLSSFLATHADTSMFLRSNVLRSGLDYRDAAYHGQYFGACGPDGEILGVIAHFWNGNIMLQVPDRDIRSALIVRLMAEIERPVCGILGVPEQVDDVIEAFGLLRQQFALYADEDLYALPLSDLIVPANAGFLVPASEFDQNILISWLRAYNIEALGAQDDEDLDKRLHREFDSGQAIAERWAWIVDGLPVALSGFNARLLDVVQVGPVWTPPQFRNRGYARRVVAATLERARAEGVSRSILFTNNPSAAKAYEAIGFRRTGKYRLALLSKPHLVAPGRAS